MGELPISHVREGPGEVFHDEVWECRSTFPSEHTRLH